MCIRDRPGAVHGTPGVHGACALRGDTAGRGHPRGSAARVGTARGARVALACGAGWYGRSGFLSGPPNRYKWTMLTGVPTQEGQPGWGKDSHPPAAPRRRSRLRRVLVWFLVSVLVLVLAAGGFGLWTVRRSFPQTDGTLQLSGLNAQAEVIRDEHGVPHIYADTEHDLFLAQGYVHAQDRFYQMDFWRHIGGGRLSEMFGESQLETDKFLRTLGWTRTAEQELELIRPETRAALEAYAEGVNAYLGSRSETELSLEYAVLGLTNRGYEPEPWTPVNTLTWVKVMSWDLCGNLSDEVQRTVLLNTLSREQVEDLYPPYAEDMPAIVPAWRADEAGGVAAAVASADVAAAGMTADLRAALPNALSRALPKLAGRVADRLDGANPVGSTNPLGGRSARPAAGIGSNNWVVSGELTASGAPLLANDTHLAAQMPSIWYETGLHLTGDPARPYDAVGYTFPGMPGIVMGHNRDIAWGVTNTGTDVQDLYIEKLDPADPNRYLTPEGWKQMEVREETIEVAGAEPVTITIRTTEHGPLISDTYEPLQEMEGPENLTGLPALTDFPENVPEEYALALRWTALEPIRTIDAAMLLNRARNLEDFRDALRYWDSPAQNFVYADTEGNIAYQMPGKTPIRPNHDGRYPIPGWTGEYEWAGFAPFESLPHEVNPERGYIVTANNSVTPDGQITVAAPTGGTAETIHTPITADWHYGHRARRIVEMLEGAAGAQGAAGVRSAANTSDTPQAIDADYFQQMHADNPNLNAETIVPYLLEADLTRADGTAEGGADGSATEGGNGESAAEREEAGALLLSLI